MTRLTRTLLTAGVVLGLGGGAALWLYTQDYALSGQRRHAELTDARLFHWGRFHVQAFTLSSVHGRISASCTERDGCRLVDPIRGPSDPEAMQALLDNVAGLMVPEPLATGEEAQAQLADYGLSPAPISFTATTTDGRVHRLWVGEKHRVDGRRFVAGGEPLRLGLSDDSFYWALDRDLFAFRAKQIFELKRDDVVKVTIDKRAVPPRTLEVTRGEPLWTVRSGSRTLDADPFVIDRFLLLLTRDLKADAFVTDHATPLDMTRYGLEQPAFRVSIETRSGHVERALVGAAPRLLGAGPDSEAGQLAPYVHIEGSSSISVAYPALLSDLDKTEEDFRDRRVLDYDISAVRSVEILHAGKPPIVLSKQGSSWRMLRPIDGPADVDRAARIVLRFSKLRASRVVSDDKTPAHLAAAGLEPPQLRVLFKGEGDALLGDLRVGKPADAKTVHVTAEGVTRIDAVADAELRLLPLSPDDIKGQR